LPGLQKRISHHGSLVRHQANPQPGDKQQEKNSDQPPAVPMELQPSVPSGKIPEEASPVPMDAPLQQADQQPLTEQNQTETAHEEPANKQDQLKAMVAGCAGWGISSSRTTKERTENRLDLNTESRSKAFWRWDGGKLRKGNVSPLRNREKNLNQAVKYVMDDEEKNTTWPRCINN
jgi:hypothetical protein